MNDKDISGKKDLLNTCLLTATEFWRTICLADIPVSSAGCGVLRLAFDASYYKG